MRVGADVRESCRRFTWSGDVPATAQEPVQRPDRPPRQAARIARLAGLGLMLVGVIILIIPNSAHLDVPNVGSDLFFDCGGALYPGSRPAEEPGISACSDINVSMLRWGLLLTIGGAATLVVASQRDRRDRG